MKKILDEIYFGNIAPDAQYIVRGSRYEKTLKRIVNLSDEMDDALDADTKKLVEQFRTAHSDLSTIASQEMWKKGFILGLRIGIEVMENESENLKSVTTDDC